MVRREHDGRQNDHPVCAASVASRHFLMAQPPLLTRRGLTLHLHSPSSLSIFTLHLHSPSSLFIFTLHLHSSSSIFNSRLPNFEFLFTISQPAVSNSYFSFPNTATISS